MHDWRLLDTARRLHDGAVIAYPTEAVYGLGCDPFNAAAVLHLLELKQRLIEQGLILIAADFSQLEPWLLPVAPELRRRAFATWPGPHTWLWPVHKDFPVWLCGAHTTVAVRVTAHPLAAALCTAFGGALVSTSANRSGMQPARDALGVRRYFGTGVDRILHGPLGNAARPTEIRDLRSGKLLRAG